MTLPIPPGIAHDCEPVRGSMWYLDHQVTGFLACRTCHQLKICLNFGHEWGLSPLGSGILWCARCHVTDGLGITAPDRARKALAP